MAKLIPHFIVSRGSSVKCDAVKYAVLFSMLISSTVQAQFALPNLSKKLEDAAKSVQGTLQQTTPQQGETQQGTTQDSKKAGKGVPVASVERFDVKGIKIGFTSADIIRVAKPQFTAVQCSDASCNAKTDDKGKKSESLFVYLSKTGKAGMIQFSGKYAVSNTMAGCSPVAKKAYADWHDKLGVNVKDTSEYEERNLGTGSNESSEGNTGYRFIQDDLNSNVTMNMSCDGSGNFRARIEARYSPILNEAAQRETITAPKL